MAVALQTLLGEQEVRANGMQSRFICNISNLTEADWLELRRHYIGASEVAAIMGLNPYASAFKVWTDKVENIHDDLSGNVHVAFGNWMEPHIRAEFPIRFLKEEGIEIEALEFPFMLQHPVHDCMSCSLDGIILHPELKTGVIEIKTASEMQWREWEEDKIPDMYYAQVQQQLNITGLKYAYIVALVGKKLLWKMVPRNEQFISIINERVLEFWHNHIVTKLAPLPAGYADDAEILKAQYPNERPGTIIRLDQCQADYNRYKELARAAKEMNLEAEAIKQKFMQAMGDNEVAMIGDKKITWKTVNRKGFVVEPKSFRMLRIN